MRRTCGRLGGGAGDHHAAIAVTDEDRVLELVHVQEPGDVVHIGREVDLGTRQVGAVSEPGQARREDQVPRLPQQARHPRPAPPTVPGTVNEDERGVCGHDGQKLARSPPNTRRGAPRFWLKPSAMYFSSSTFAMPKNTWGCLNT